MTSMTSSGSESPSATTGTEESPSPTAGGEAESPTSTGSGAERIAVVGLAGFAGLVAAVLL